MWHTTMTSPMSTIASFSTPTCSIPGHFAHPSFSLEQAQEAKKRHIAAKLLIEPGLRVLDIGCGWGGLTLSLAEMERVEVVGVTLSREQLTVARKRAKQARLEERVRFALQDYREIKGSFDRIVSVGMFEPALSEVAPVIERAGLVHLHCAETLRHWRERFIESHRQEGRTCNQRFCSMWEFTSPLVLAFRYGCLMVFQAQL